MRRRRQRNTDALRESARRGRPFGGPAWQAETAARLKLQSTFRPPGGPKKKSEPEKGRKAKTVYLPFSGSGVFERKDTAGTALPRKDESVRSADPTGITGRPEANTAPRPFRVGIAWQGDPAFANDRDRSVPLLHFAPLAAVPGVRLYSLQKNHGVEQLAAAREQFPITELTPPLDEECGAFLDTAAVMANLDLVISSDTSLVHLAGALGVQVWMATSFACDWRWLRDRDDSPWYGTS